MRPAVDTIHAPPFPRGLPWINTEQLRIDKQLGRPLVIAFWDSRRAVSISPLLELQRWHETYGGRGARVIAVHVDGDGEGIAVEEIRAAVDRFGFTMPVVVDEELRIADAFGLTGVPSRYLFDQGLKLVDAHYGLGGFADGERLLAALVEHGERSLAERRAQGEADANVAPAVPASEAEEDESCDQGASVPVAKQPRLIVTPPPVSELPAADGEPDPFVAPEPAELLPSDYRGPYAAGGVWLRLRGTGTLTVSGEAPVEIPGPGTYLVARTGIDAPGILDFALAGDLVCDEIQLEPGTEPVA